MRVLVTGVKGQLGYDICNILNNKNIANIGVDIEDFDITDANATISFIKSYNPDIIIHCAAYTAVDKAEENVELCKKININGTQNIVEACKITQSKFVFFSTDYVFNGEKSIKEEYEVDDYPSPLSVYGKSKLAGEQIVLAGLIKYYIIRTSWMFGKNGTNFIETIIRLCKTHATIDVVCDQIGSPTYTVDLAEAVCKIIFTEKYGVYQITNSGFCSWADFAENIIAALSYPTKVNRILSENYNTKAIRPKNSKLSKSSLVKSGFDILPPWEDALLRYLDM
ncbi:MAG: dTDP-4-dehydrorhamnose reductase [Hydrogenoanaerobacterium sp.]